MARELLGGLKTTLWLTLWSMVVGVAVGILLGLVFTWKRRLGWIVRAYVEIWRGIPVLVTLFMLFFALPSMGIQTSAFASALLALALWGSANVAEITRGAIQSIPRAQSEAAALGMRWGEAMVLVILPQAIRRMTPSIVGTLTQLIQTTALASAIGLLELVEAGARAIERLSSQTGSSPALPIMGAVLIMYFVISFPLTHLSRRLEARLERLGAQRRQRGVRAPGLPGGGRRSRCDGARGNR